MPVLVRTHVAPPLATAARPQVAALRALGTFLSVVSDDDRVAKRYERLLEPLVRVTERCVAVSEDAAIASLDALSGAAAAAAAQGAPSICHR